MECTNIDDINYDAIKYFINVADHNSLSKSAYSLGISQSALSQSMKNLEESLGVTLFNRNTRGIILTTEGRRFYEEAKLGKEHFENAIIQVFRLNKFETLRNFKISTSGTLFSYFIAPIMREITQKYPKINFEIVSSATDRNVVEKIQREEVDLAIIKSYDNFSVKEVANVRLDDIKYVFAYNPKYFDFKDKVKFDDIKDIPVINKRRKGRNDNSWMMISFDHLIHCESDRNVVELIKQGIGIGLLPQKYIEKEELRMLDFEELPLTTRSIETVFLPSNEVAKDIVNMIKNNQQNF